MRLYGEIVDRTGAQTMFYLTCTMISSVDLAHYGLPRAKDWVTVDCGTIYTFTFSFITMSHNMNKRYKTVFEGVRGCRGEGSNFYLVNILILLSFQFLSFL